MIAESFAPIFAANCIRNGLLPVVLPRDAIAVLAGQIVTIDLAAQSVTAGDQSWRFAIDAEPKAMLLEGLDAIDLTLKHRPEIDAWTALTGPRGHGSIWRNARDADPRFRSRPARRLAID